VYFNKIIKNIHKLILIDNNFRLKYNKYESVIMGVIVENKHGINVEE